MILYAGRASEKKFLNEVTCGAEDDYMRARKILKRLLMNGMIIPEYNFVGGSTVNSDDKIPEHIEKILVKINKIILEQISKLFEDNSQIIYFVAEKIVENSSIVSEDIYEIFKTTNKENSIGSYDINLLIEEISKEILTER
jgi:ATP-dependent Zn protease